MGNKLTKASIRKWLEQKEREQLSELYEQQEKELAEVRLAFMKKQGFISLYEKYESSIREFKKEWDALYDNLIDNEVLGPTYYTLVGDKLRNLVGNGNIGDCDIKNVDIISNEYKEFTDKQYMELDNIREEWGKLIHNINALNSVKKILAYLNDIGIDTSEITPVKEEMLPATPIRVSLLKL